MTWTAPDVERSEHYPARRNEPEQEMLRDWLDWHRATLLRKCAGLDATRLAKRAVPPSNLSLLGLVRHMSDTERGWVRQTFRGEQVPDLYYRSDARDADFEEADPAGAEEDLERYRAECRAVDAALEGAKLDDTFTLREKTTSVRWMWQHLVEEYARHNGHADLLREAIDGSAGLLAGQGQRLPQGHRLSCHARRPLAHLHHVIVSPGKTGDIVRAALVLTHFEHGYIT
ncbi:MAG TPA: DinB family protein [Streptosporangiaceae bacterium]|nr:DinB family protein [Streptosporangiaceae bacterium]